MSNTVGLILNGNGGVIALGYPFQITGQERFGLFRDKVEEIHMEQENEFWNPYKETAEGYALSIPLPGRKKEEIRIEARHGFLEVATRQGDSEKGSAFSGSEEFIERFQQSFSIPDDVEPKGLSALFRDGVLSILLPRLNGSFLKAVSVEV